MELTRLYRYNTEREAAQAYVLRLLRYHGAKEGGLEHRQFVDDYNTLAKTAQGLPRGIKAVMDYDWCAIFAAGQAHAMGLTEAYPMEMSCSLIIEKAKAMGLWIEGDSYIPCVGDWVIFAWEAPEGENMEKPDHIGVVYDCDGEIIRTVEGNKGNKVDSRAFLVGDKRIRGFVHPDLSGLIGTVIAPVQVPTAGEPVEPVNPKLPILHSSVEDVPEWGRAAVQKLVDRGALQGVGEGDLALSEDLVRVLTILDRCGAFDLPI